MKKYLVKICEYGFLLSMMLFILLTIFNSWTDYIFNEYLNSQIVLIFGLLFGILLAFISSDSMEIKNKNE